ncbi:MAG TPA: 30S ribosomal protein S1, partial [Phycisphaerales bacterium]|nr:30S ribosomal protein S1 [Phycisphaerales bacterium]
PQDIVTADQEVEVKILRVDTDERKIGLSLKRAQWGGTEEDDLEGGSPEGGDFEKPKPTRGGMDDHGAMGTDKIEL